MSVPGIESLGPAYGAAGTDPTAATRAASGTQGPDGPAFGRLLVDGLERLEALHDGTDALAVRAATGDLGAIHSYTIAATETSVATQLTVAMRNKAVEAFTEIMRMHVG
jgi:flagellar hook-basal body complex protein FliE